MAGAFFKRRHAFLDSPRGASTAATQVPNNEELAAGGPGRG